MQFSGNCMMKNFVRGKRVETKYSTFLLKSVEKNQAETDHFDVEMRSHKNYDSLVAECQLVTATINADYELMTMLLKSEFSKDCIDYNRFLCYSFKRRQLMTPLQIAAAQGNYECLELLIQYGANIDAEDAFGVTATHLAAEQGNDDCLRLLLETGAKCTPTKTMLALTPFFCGTTPLHLAAANNHALCLQILIQFGADYNEIDEKGRTGLYIAAQLGYEECVLTQLKNAVGREILSLPDTVYGYTPLHFAVKLGMVRAIKQLLEKGSDVNHQNADGLSPLHLCLAACKKNKTLALEILKLLILYGYNTDINKMDQLNRSPLHYVTFSNGPSMIRCPEIAKFLIAFGANTHIYNNKGCSLINYEFNSPDTDATVLKAILDSLEFPPVLSMHKLPIPMVPDRVNNCAAQVRIVPLKNDPHGQFMQRWLRTSYPQPPSLKHFCRNTIRKTMGPSRLRFVGILPLPQSVKSYILLGVKL